MADEVKPQADAPVSGDSEMDRGLLGKLAEALTGLLPLLDNIKSAIAESSGKIPKASSQLNSVTQATETATVEILNALDGLSQNIDSAESGMTRLRGLLGNAGDVGAGIEAALTEISSTLAKSKESSMNIAMALQVQDITSQQIAGVNLLIEDVRIELLRILEHLGSEVHVASRLIPSRPKHFDTDAKYDGSGERQEQADMIIQQWASKNNE